MFEKPCQCPPLGMAPELELLSPSTAQTHLPHELDRPTHDVPSPHKAPVSKDDDTDPEDAEIGENEAVDHSSLPREHDSSRRKQRDNAALDAFLSQHGDELLAKSKEKRTAEDEEDCLSLKQLLERQESTRIISNPRQYQTDLFETAKARNTIAVLETGSGKTLIAVMLLRHIIDQELEDRANNLPSRIAFFLVSEAFQLYAWG